MSIEERPVATDLVEPFLPRIEEGPAESVDGLPMILEEADFQPLPRALPVDGLERVNSVDVIRGVALMGILAMNIVGFAWPNPVYSVPIAAPDHHQADLWLWGFNHLFFDTKMMTLFSMLFGAGLVLMSDRAEGRGAKLGWIYYRRVFWLLVIGCIHAYLIWEGDILVWYALCGFLLYPIRNWSARTLIIVGLVLSSLTIPLWLGFRFGVVPYMKETASQVEAEARIESKLSDLKDDPETSPSSGLEGLGQRIARSKKEWDKGVSRAWEEMIKSEPPKREDFLRRMFEYRGSYGSIVKKRAWPMFMEHTFGSLVAAWWLIGGRMLIGMGLMKLGAFSARLSNRSYRIMMTIGYGLGLPLMLFDVIHESSHGFFQDRQFWYAVGGWPLITINGSLLVVFGHIGLVMLICKSKALPWLTRRLGAAGRMALSCYLFDSIFCTTMFYGYGFDYFGTLHRPLLYAVVITIWVSQLLVCPLWLEKFRFGPAEWLWRSLTYWKFQSMKPRTA